MFEVSLEDIAKITGGIVRQGDPAAVFRRVGTDSRALEPGSLFFALRGDKFDAHEFLGPAIAAGAAGLVVDRPTPVNNVPVVEAPDTLAGLQALASWNRSQGEAPLVGITGSSGKTSTKDILSSILSVRLRTVKTPGNYNNEIGLPLTVLQMDEHSEIAVVEMGMRGLGQIDALCRIARPTVAVITNIGEAHIELLGSVDNIAAAKGEILDHVPDNGCAVLPAAGAFIQREAGRCRGKVVFYGIEQDCAVSAKNIRANEGGSCFTVETEGFDHEFYLPIPGRHNVLNALAAIAVGLELGFSADEIGRGLRAAVISGMRQEIINTGNITIINDTYNANPDSVKAALQTLQEISAGRKTVAVLGGMMELGEREAAGHRVVGAAAAVVGVDRLVTVGSTAANIAVGAKASGMPEIRIYPCADKLEAGKTLNKIIQPGDVILVKGSRSMGMEQIVEQLIMHNS